MNLRLPNLASMLYFASCSKLLKCSEAWNIFTKSPVITNSNNSVIKMTDHPLAKKYFLNCSNTFGFDHLKSAFDDKIIKSDQSFANLLSRSRSPFSNKFFLAFSLIPLLLSGPTDCALQIISSLSNPFFTMCNAHMIMNQRKRRKERKKEILHCVCNFILPFQFKIWKVDLFKWNFFLF